MTLLDKPLTAEDLLERYCTAGRNDDLEFAVGLASAWLGTSHEWRTTKRVWDVHVHVDHRGQGHGRRLMEVLTAYADAVGTALDLFVYADNEPAIRLYRSVGFVIERTNEASIVGFSQTTHYMVRPAHQNGA